ncbi:MAG: GTP 3',8-cyclase MoaA [Candidatus Omnitrophica bacterium]|nr:GTP 3',8-cyclase MoaA [Candidatus Omnitrophota bacterium]MBU1851147.1 GTP 3',8-cyclase MoaA [Candidatus Omnitrophota bacterium]
MKTDYLRISITDKCNLRCMYCHPFVREDFIPHAEILRFEEITRIVEYLESLGIGKIRITGGEPLVKNGIEDLVFMIKEIPGIEEVNMTTNGILLNEKYDSLKCAGLNRINISLNTLKRERYEKMMGGDYLPIVLRAVKEAAEEENAFLKINSILFKGVNDDEIIDLVEFAVQHDICIRFIECYSTNNEMTDLERKCIPNTVVKKIIENKFGLLKQDIKFPDNGPAQTFMLPGARSAVGFISAHTENFCGHCTRLRLSSDGKIFPCLFSRDYLDVKALLRGRFTDSHITEKLLSLITGKCDYSKENRTESNFSLRSIGG